MAARTAADIQRGTHRMQGQQAAEGIHHFPCELFEQFYVIFKHS
jgi:hypothetical protein